MKHRKIRALAAVFPVAFALLILLPSCTHGHRSGPDELVISTSSLPGTSDDPWPVGVPYEAKISATRSYGPYEFTWYIGGTLPEGLEMLVGGTIVGVPTQTGTFIFLVQVVDTGVSPAQTANKVFTITIGTVSQGSTFAITPDPLPTASVNLAYSHTLTTVGNGIPPYTWSTDTDSPVLPEGMAFSSGGHLAGTPTFHWPIMFTSFAIVFRVVDSSSPVAKVATMAKTLDVTIITTDTLPKGRVGQSYSSLLSVSGDTTPYTWSIASGNLPNGISLNSSTGEISGIPIDAGLWDFVAQILDGYGTNYTRSLSLQIDPAQSLRITTDSNLLAGQVDIAYVVDINAAGGSTPYTFSLDAGSLPPGITFSSGGTLLGIPETSGTYSFAIRATDSTSPVAGEVIAGFNLTINLAGRITVRQETLPTALQNDLYQTILSAIGGSPPYIWSWSGATPAGLNLSTSGVISGVPTAYGTSTFEVQVTDGTLTNQKTLDLQVVQALVVATTSLPYAIINEAYSGTLSVTGGNAPYLWSMDTGSPDLPNNLTLSVSGHITGTPIVIGQHSFAAKVTDSSSPPLTASKALIIDVKPPLSITTTTLPSATEGSPYSSQLTASGGSGFYTWSVVGLPAGLSCNSTSGTISGTPGAGASASSPYTINVTVQDVYIPSASNSRSYFLTVYPPP